MEAINHRRDLGVPLGSREIIVDGVRLAVSREGAGPAVICLHATGHGGRDFEAFAVRARERFEVIRVDWPGQGRSGEDDRGRARPARYAALLRGVVMELGLEAPIIIGCSIGGATAIRYGSQYPVKALVLANTGGLVAVTPTVARACRFFSRIFAAGAGRAWWYKAVFALYYRMVLPSSAAAAQRRRIVKAAYETAPSISDAWSGFAEPDADIRALAVALDVPVLFAWAMGDKINQFSVNEPTIRLMKRARVAKFKGGHAAFLEQPELFIRQFQTFIDETKRETCLSV